MSVSASTPAPPPMDAAVALLADLTAHNTTNNSSAAGDDEAACATPDEYRQIGVIAATVAPTAFAVIFLVGLVGNALVCVVVLCNAQMRTTTNVLILNLAASDLLFVVFCLPFTAVDYATPVWPFGELWCKTVQYLIVVTANASIFTLVLMSLDRYLAVVHPIASRAYRNERNTVHACALMWAVIVVASVPAWFVHGIVVSLAAKTLALVSCVCVCAKSWTCG